MGQDVLLIQHSIPSTIVPSWRGNDVLRQLEETDDDYSQKIMRTDSPSDRNGARSVIKHIRPTAKRGRHFEIVL